MFWGENFLVSYLICVLRYCFILHATWAVNSFAHMFGSKPYDKNINPSENIWVSLFAAGNISIIIYIFLIFFWLIR